MLNNFDSTIESISEERLESLFEEPVKGQPSPKDLPAAKVEKVEDKEEEKSEIEISEHKDDIEIVEDLEDILKDKDDKEDKDKGKEDVEDKDGKDDKEEKEDTENSDVKGILKSTVDFLIEKGEWFDFEGREDLDIDEKKYAELALKQTQAKVSEMFNELVDSTGPYGKAIIGFVSKGGDPEQIIDIFKEKKEVESFDTSSEDGKKALISKYYKEVLNWKGDRIDRHISGLIANDELDTESSEITNLFDEYHKKELQRISEKQEIELEKEREREERFKDSIVSAIDSRKDISEKDKKLLEKSILQYSNKLADGTQVSDFYVKFAKTQSNPEEYIDLVRFVMDKEAYIKSLKKEIENKVTEKTFNFVKGNTALSNKKGSGYDKIDRNSNKIVDFDFGLKSKK